MKSRNVCIVLFVALIMAFVAIIVFLFAENTNDKTKVVIPNFFYSFSKEELGEITEVTISRSGTMVPITHEYKLVSEHGRWVATCYDGSVWIDEDMDVNRTEVSDEFAEEILQILSDNGVKRWDGFNKRDRNVTDAETFDFLVKFSDGDTIKAEGYATYPENFHEVYGEIQQKYELLFGE